MKEQQARRKEIRAEQEKKLAQQKKEEEERIRKEELEKKVRDAEEKRKRLEEAEKKRQTMVQAQKEKRQAAGFGPMDSRKGLGGVRQLRLEYIKPKILNSSPVFKMQNVRLSRPKNSLQMKREFL